MGTKVGAGSGNVRASDPHLPVEGDLLGKNYEVAELIGRGGMGAVYRATHKGLHRDFAVKVVSVHGHSPDAARRLVQEARTASAIDHENIVDVTDLGHTKEGLVYVGMELLKGRDLAERLVEHRMEHEGGLPLDEARRVGTEVIAGLRAAHEDGVVHRDLKPANVFLAERRGKVTVKLLDFGMSKLTDNESAVQITKTGDLVGTPLYMAPEQSRGSDVDQRADIYSLGVVLYEMVTGVLPFEANSPTGYVLKHIHEEPRPAIEREPSIPVPLDRLIRELMAKDPVDRPVDAHQVVERLTKDKQGLD